MAKLSSHGRRELARVSRERSYPDRAANDLVSWERTTLALMSDGVVLQKLDSRFWPGPYDTPGEVAAGGRLHSYGWKVYAKHVKAEFAAPERFVAWAEARGYRV